MINENNDFSVEDSEELIKNLNSNAAPEFEKLRSTLNLLSHVNELSPISIPPVLPSEIGQPVQLLTRKSSKPRRTVITSILAVGILASASLAAAAVTGRGPAPIVNAGHQSAKLVKAVAGAVSHAVTGKNSDSPTKNDGGKESGNNESDGQSGDSEGSLTGPSSLPSSDGNDDKSTSNSGSDENEGNSLSATPPSKSEHSGDKGSKESSKSSSKEGEKNHSSNDGSRTPRATPSPEPTNIQSSGIPKPTSSPGDQSSSEEND